MRDTTNRILDDLAKLATEAAGAAQGLRRDAETALRSGLERILRDMDLVTREDFEAVRDMAILAREQNENLEARIAVLEARLNGPLGGRPESGR